MEYYSPKELAKYFSISYGTILNMIKNGEIHATKIGRQYRIHASEVKKLEGEFNESIEIS